MQSDPPPKRRRWPFVVLGLFLLFALVWGFGGGVGSPVRKPVAIERGADGSFGEIEWPTDDWFNFSMQIGGRNSNRKTSSSLSQASPDNARFAGRRIAVLANTEGALTDLVCRQLVEQLAADSLVEEFIYLPFGSSLEDGAIRPDLFIDVRVPVHEGTTIFGAGSSHVLANARVSRDLFLGQLRSTEDDVPVVMIDCELEVDLTSNYVGISTPNAALQDLAGEVSRSLSESMLASFSDLRASHGELGSTDELVPEFQRLGEGVAALPMDDLEGWRRLVSLRGPLVSNESWWETSTDGDVQKCLEPLRDRLAAVGFEIEMSENGYLRATRGEELVLASREQAWRPVGMVSPSAASAAADDGPVRVFARYRRMLGEEGLRGAVESTLDGNTPWSVAALLRHSWSADDRERALQLLENGDVDDPHEYVDLARLYDAAGEQEKAARALRLARILALIQLDVFNDPDEFVVNAAKKMDVEIATDRRFREEDLQAAGLRPLAGDSVSVELAPGVEHRFYVPGDEGGPIALIAVGLGENAGGTQPALLFDARGVRQHSVGTGPRSFNVFGGGAVHFEPGDPPPDGSVRWQVELKFQR